MLNHWERVRTVARAAVTWLVLASTVLTIAAEELARVAGADSPVVVLMLRVVAWLGVAVAIIRRSTPVLPDARGILPTGAIETETERLLIDAVMHGRAVEIAEEG
jgi:hypothetical protein